LDRVKARALDHVFPGSWINANVDVWIGAEEDNRAWEYLLAARQTYERVHSKGNLTEADRKLAYEELLIAEGSDWCWWYGPEHASDNKQEFDQLYREHLANVYRALHVPAPDELSRPILHLETGTSHQLPLTPIRAIVDGEVTSYFEWLGAGSYSVDARSGAMHGQRFLVHDLLYGSDGEYLFLRLDFEPNVLEALAGAELRLALRGAGENAQQSYAAVELENGNPKIKDLKLAGSVAGGNGFLAGFRRILEIGISLKGLGVAPPDPIRLQISLWRNGLPLDALPVEGWLEISTREPSPY